MNKPVFIFESALFTTSGYGMWSMDLAKSLLRYNKTHNDKYDIKTTKISMENIQNVMDDMIELINKMKK